MFRKDNEKKIHRKCRAVLTANCYKRTVVLTKKNYTNPTQYNYFDKFPTQPFVR